MTEAELRDWLTDALAEVCSVDPSEVDVHRPMGEYGMSSRDAVGLAGDLEDLLDTDLPTTLLWDHPTIAGLAAALLGEPEQAAETVAVQEKADSDEIAVIGIGCRLPGGADGPERFWSLLRDGRDGVGEVPAGRWPSGSGASTVGGFLRGVDRFDAEFFAITPAEARRMDPQQRMLLEVAHEALLDAALSPEALRGSRTGVFVGISGNEYGHRGLTDPEAVDAYSATGAALAVAANRLSYALDLRGPSLAVDTACSSSLVAVHNAVRSLRSGESSAALACGANLLLGPAVTASFDKLGISAPGGRCRPFSADADGIVRAEGAAVLVLKRLADARADGDRVLAVIAGSAVNSDGRSNGLTAPNPEAQQAVLRDAYADAGVDPAAVDYVEAHGTGTLLGDPIEARALGAVLGRDREHPLLVGSVKSNLGHLEAAAGIAGVAKVVLSLAHGMLPPSLHFAAPNPHIDFPGLGLAVADTLRPLAADGSAVAGVSGFGFGGTNAHVVIRQVAPEPAAAPAQRPGWHRITLGDRTTERLGDYARVLADELDAGALAAADLARSTARALHGPVRRAVVARDTAGLAAGLRALAEGTEGADAAVLTGHRGGGTGAVWVFSGHGSQWAGMGRELLAASPVFAATIDELEPLLRRETGLSVREVITADAEPTAMAAVQPALFAMQLGLAALWQANGHRPAAVLGHSLGEIAAAVVAGALTVEQGARVIARRSRLLDVVAGQGGMAVLALGVDEAAALLADEPEVSVAAVNAPKETVICGATDGINRVVQAVTRRGLFAKAVKATSPAHSSMLDPLMDTLASELADLTPAEPRIPCYRTATDDPRSTEPFDGPYWVCNFRETVRFAPAVAAAVEDGADVFVEIGPHAVLAGPLGEVLAAQQVRRPQVLASMRRDEPALAEFHRQLAVLALAGLADEPTTGRVVALPRPRWQHRSFWVDEQSGSAGEHPLLGAHVRLPVQGSHAWQRKAALDTERMPWLGEHLGAAEYLEITLAAATAAFGTGPAELAVTGLTLDRPLPVADDARLCTTLHRTGRRAAVTVTSRVGGAPARVHARAEVALAVAAPAQPPQGTAEPLTPGEHRLSAAWRTAPDLLAGLLATVTAVDTVRWYADPREATTVVTEPGDTLALTDAEGTVLLRLTGITRSTVAAPPTALRDKLYGLRWQPAAAPPPAGLTDDVAVLGDDERVQATAEALWVAGATVTTGPLDPAALPNPLPATVVAVVPRNVDPVDGHRALADVIAVVRGLEGATHTRLWLLTENGAALDDAAAVDPFATALRASVRVLAFEQPELRPAWLDTDDVTAVAAELAADSAEDEVAWRAGNRYVARISPTTMAVDPDAGTVVRPDGAYVLTGALRGIGLAMARWLADAGAARIVLNGRSEPDDTARTVIAGLRASGTDIVVLTGDIAEDGVADRLVAAAGAGGVPVRGVVHVAAVYGLGVTARIDTATLEKVWRPKALGAWRLHRATLDLDLDFWLAFSSMVALLGYPGDAAYCPANAFVDGLAAHRRALGLPANTVNWGAWAEVGQAAERNMDILALTPADPVEYLEALEAALTAGSSSLGIAALSGEGLLALSENLADLPFFADVVTATEDDTGWPGPDGLRLLDPGRARALLDARLVHRVATVMGVAEEGFDRHTPLTSLGIDSLVAVRIRNAVQHDLDVLLPPSLLLRGASVTDVQEWLAGEVLAARVEVPVQGERPVLVPPRDAAERLVVAVATGVVGHAIGMTQQLADIATTEQVTEIAEQLTRRSGRVVTTAELLARRSVERCAELVREPEHPDQLVRVLRRAGQDSEQLDRPLFLFHPGGGDTLVYRQMVDHMAPGFAVYGFDRVDNVPAIADRIARYLPLLRDIQPRGPYRLAGWSFGGVLAYEMAAQLRAAGEQVELVAMIDSVIPKPIPDGMDEVGVLELRFHRFSDFLRTCYGLEVELPYAEMARLEDEAQINLLTETIEKAGLINAEVAPAIIRHQQTSYADVLAGQRYRPPYVDARVVLYSVSEYPEGGMRDPLYERHDTPKGWDDILGDDMEIVAAPGHHLSVLDPPNVYAVATHLSELLATPLRART